jgi:hypothetical protein
VVVRFCIRKFKKSLTARPNRNYALESFQTSLNVGAPIYAEDGGDEPYVKGPFNNYVTRGVGEAVSPV